MQSIITITPSMIGGQTVNAVSARELHQWLEVGRDFSTWIKARIEEYGFKQCVDFVALPASGEAQPRGFAANRKDFFLSIDMAKELSMVERNDKGRQARQYFIECEKRAQAMAPAIPDFSDPVAAARAWADAKESEQAALAAAEAARPAVEFVEQYVHSDSGNKGFRQVAKLLRANEREFRQFLSDKKVLYKLGGEWMPYQQHVDAGRFEVKTGTGGDGAHVFNQAKFTPKGINWIAGLWGQYRAEQAK